MTDSKAPPTETNPEDPTNLTLYSAALSLCNASGLHPLIANRDPRFPETINDLLEKLGRRLPPIPDHLAKELSKTTIYSLSTIQKAFA